MNRTRVKKNIILALILIIVCGLAFILVWTHYQDSKARYEEDMHQQELDAVEEYSGQLDAEALSGLDQYRNLRKLDLSGSPNYDEIREYIDSHPQVEVTYTVDLGGTEVKVEAAEVSLKSGEYSLQTMQENLAYLPDLKLIRMEDLHCTPEELQALREAYPDIEIHYSVSILGNLYPDNTYSMDLTRLEPEDVDAAAAALALLPDLETVELTDEEGGNRLGFAEVSRLQQANPDALFRYRFTFYKQELSTEDERVVFFRVWMGNGAVEQIREFLPCLTRCKYFLLDDCGIDNELLAQLRDDFPDTKIVWRVHISYLNFLTDVQVIHLTFLLTNQNAQVMRYCNEVEYLDIGHNTISDITFMGYMPHLKYVILSYNKVSDLSPLSNCKELEMLELYQCFNLEDLSPLAECESLQLLNVSWTGVSDITPVYGLKNLQRFYCIWNYTIPDEQREQIRKELPNCWITFEQNVSKNVGWSFDADGGVRAQWYLDMYKILRYRVEDWFFGYYPED